MLNKEGERIGIRHVRMVILTLAVLFISVGIMEQEYLDVFEKAVRICLECIGIG